MRPLLFGGFAGQGLVVALDILQVQALQTEDALNAKVLELRAWSRAPSLSNGCQWTIRINTRDLG